MREKLNLEFDAQAGLLEVLGNHCGNIYMTGRAGSAAWSTSIFFSSSR
jgi:hypothetical protein